MSDFGAKFEKDFKASAEDQNLFVYRIKTRSTAYMGDNEIGDFFLYRKPTLIALELKSTKEKRLPFAMIRPNQLKGLFAASWLGVEAGILVQLREPEYSHWYVPIGVIYKAIEDGAKSLPLKTLQEDPRILPVKFTKKRVSVKLDVADLISAIEGGITC